MNKLFIFGDSYSTFKGEIPEGYYDYYIPAPCDYADVVNKEETWWWQLKEECGMELVRNDSWSGSAVCKYGYGGNSGWNSFLTRFETLRKENRLDPDIDTFIVFGGTNDFWSESPFGEEKYGDITEEDKMQVYPAFAWLLTELRALYPNADILTVINCDLSDEFAETLKRVAEKCNTTPVVLQGIDKMNGHPTKIGMTQIKDQIKVKLK